MQIFFSISDRAGFRRHQYRKGFQFCWYFLLVRIVGIFYCTNTLNFHRELFHPIRKAFYPISICFSFSFGHSILFLSVDNNQLKLSCIYFVCFWFPNSICDQNTVDETRLKNYLKLRKGYRNVKKAVGEKPFSFLAITSSRVKSCANLVGPLSKPRNL